MSIPRGIKSALNHFNIGFIIDLLGAQHTFDWCGYVFCPCGWEEDDEGEPIANVKVYKKSVEFDNWMFEKVGDEPDYTLLVFKI